MLNTLSPFSPSNNSPICATETHSSLQTPVQGLVGLRKQQDAYAGITHYKDEITGGEISFDDYWAAKEFESQPFYQLGANLNKLGTYLFESVINVINNIIGFIKFPYDAYRTNTAVVDQALVDNNVSMINKIQQDKTNLFLQHYINKRENNLKAINVENHQMYAELDELIQDAAANASAANKPLFILIGEDRTAAYSAMVEAMVLDIVAKRKLSNKMLTEAFFINDDKKCFYEIFAKNGITCMPIRTAEQLAQQQKIQKIPFDMVSCADFAGYDNVPAYCADGVQRYTDEVELMHGSFDFQLNPYKEHKMAQNAATYNENIIGIVGEEHLKGIAENPELLAKMNILPISTAKTAATTNYTFNAYLTKMMDKHSIYEKPILTPDHFIQKAQAIQNKV